MAYSRIRRRRYLRRPRRIRRRFARRRRPARYTLRRSKRQNKWLAPMLQYNPVQARTRIVKVVYDFCNYNQYILVSKGANMVRGTDIALTEPIIRAANPQAPCKTGSGGGDAAQAHGMSYWATYYKQYQVLRSNCTVKIYPHTIQSTTSYDTISPLVFQLRCSPDDLATNTDWETNQFLPTTVTRFLKPELNKNRPLTLKSFWTWSTLHGTKYMPEVRTFGASPDTGDQDAYQLYMGKRSKANNDGSRTSVPFNVQYHVVYTIRLIDPKAINTNYPTQGVAPSADAGEGISEVPKLLFAGAPSGQDGEDCSELSDEEGGELCCE